MLVKLCWCQNWGAAPLFQFEHSSSLVWDPLTLFLSFCSVRHGVREDRPSTTGVGASYCFSVRNACSYISTWSEVTTYCISAIKCCSYYLFHCVTYYGYYSRAPTIQVQCLLKSAWNIFCKNNGFEKGLVIMLLHGAEAKIQASSFTPLPCYKALYTWYHFLAFFQWIHKLLILCVSLSAKVS